MHANFIDIRPLPEPFFKRFGRCNMPGVALPGRRSLIDLTFEEDMCYIRVEDIDDVVNWPLAFLWNACFPHDGPIVLDVVLIAPIAFGRVL